MVIKKKKTWARSALAACVNNGVIDVSRKQAVQSPQRDASYDIVFRNDNKSLARRSWP